MMRHAFLSHPCFSNSHAMSLCAVWQLRAPPLSRALMGIHGTSYTRTLRPCQPEHVTIYDNLSIKRTICAFVGYATVTGAQGEADSPFSSGLSCHTPLLEWVPL
jgi:hypothetical protein